jgi:hypothetical protein
MAYAAGRSGARLSVHTAQALTTLAGIHANPSRELQVYKNTRRGCTLGCCILLRSMAFTASKTLRFPNFLIFN